MPSLIEYIISRIQRHPMIVSPFILQLDCHRTVLVELVKVEQQIMQLVQQLIQKEYRQMDSKPPMIESTKEIIGNYAISVSLTKQMHVEVNRSINQLSILALLYVAENDQVKKFIDAEMLTIQRKVRESTKASSSLFSRFIGGRQSGRSAVSINDVWIKLSENNMVQHYGSLVNEMANLKKREQGKQ